MPGRGDCGAAPTVIGLLGHVASRGTLAAGCGADALGKPVVPLLLLSFARSDQAEGDVLAGDVIGAGQRDSSNKANAMRKPTG